MPPRLDFLRACNSIAPRVQPSIVVCRPRFLARPSRRGFADEKDPKPATGPNQESLGHVSEEAADVSRITGETEPDIGQGTPVQDVSFRVGHLEMA